MKYLKLFNSVEEKDAYFNGSEVFLPNVSFVVENDTCYYKPLITKINPKVVMYYDTTLGTKANSNSMDGSMLMLNDKSNIISLKIDDEKIPLAPFQMGEVSKNITPDDVNINLETGDISVNTDKILIIDSTLNNISIEVQDDNFVIDEHTFMCMYSLGMGTTTLEYCMIPINSGLEQGMVEMISPNKISMTSQFITELKNVIAEANAMGLIMDLCLFIASDANETWTIYDNVMTVEMMTGGLEIPYYFETEGKHKVEIELSSTGFGGMTLFASPLGNNDIDIAGVTKIETYGVEKINTGAFCFALSLRTVILGEGLKEISDNITHLVVLDKLVIPDNTEKIGLITEGMGWPTAIELGENIKEVADGFAGWSEVVIFKSEEVPSFVTETTFEKENPKLLLMVFPITKDYSEYGVDWFKEVPYYKSKSLLRYREFNYITCHFGDYYTEFDETKDIKLYGRGNINSIYPYLTYFNNGGGMKSTFKQEMVTSKYNIGHAMLLCDTKIPDYAFANCYDMTLFGFNFNDTPEPLIYYAEEIGYNAFENCTSLKKIVLSRYLTYIHSNAFKNCTSLNEIYCKTTYPPVLEDSNIFNDLPDNGILHLGSDLRENTIVSSFEQAWAPLLAKGWTFTLE